MRYITIALSKGRLAKKAFKDPNDKHKIIVDPEAANYLNAHGIDTPSAYKKRKGSKK